jgi:hypothetical protein
MSVVTDTDFARLAAELRLASLEAQRDAARRPLESEDLRRKARHLALAAARIQEDARARDGFFALEGIDEA